MEVNGTHIWYYFICPREVWLMMRQIAPDQEDDLLEIGRFINENTYQRQKQEIVIGNIKIDRIRTENGQLVIGEVKKSSRYLKSARYQLLFYLDTLRKMGIEAKGELLFPEERRRETVEWTEEGKRQLDRAVAEILNLAKQTVPPKPEKISYCKQCAYREYCWAEE